MRRGDRWEAIFEDDEDRRRQQQTPGRLLQHRGQNRLSARTDQCLLKKKDRPTRRLSGTSGVFATTERKEHKEKNGRSLAQWITKRTQILALVASDEKMRDAAPAPLSLSKRLPKIHALTVKWQRNLLMERHFLHPAFYSAGNQNALLAVL